MGEGERRSTLAAVLVLGLGTKDAARRGDGRASQREGEGEGAGKEESEATMRKIPGLGTVIEQTTHDVRFDCPFCTGGVETVDEDHALVHTVPPCALFVQLDVVDFMKRCNAHFRAQGRN